MFKRGPCGLFFLVYKLYTFAKKKVHHVVKSYKESCICEHLVRFPAKSFRRWGDFNAINRIVRANYMSHLGVPIDVQAMDITEATGVTIEPDDIVEFVYKYLRKPKFIDYEANHVESEHYHSQAH